MKRTIKFRAWDVYYRECFYSDKCESMEEFWRMVREGGGEGTVQEFTGLLDKNGKEIYEGDICIVDLRGVPHRGTMMFDVRHAQFGLDVSTEIESVPDHLSSPELPEIIGNIYEHPDLLKA